MAFIKNTVQDYSTNLDLFRILKASARVIRIYPDSTNEGLEQIIINQSSNKWSVPTNYNINLNNTGLAGRLDNYAIQNNCYYGLLAVFDEENLDLLGFGCIAIPQIAYSSIVSIISNIAEINLSSNFIFNTNSYVLIENSDGTTRRGKIIAQSSFNPAKAFVLLDPTGDSLTLSITGTITQINNFAPVNQASTSKLELTYTKYKFLEPFFSTDGSGNISIVYNRQTRNEPLNHGSDYYKLWDYPNIPNTQDQIIYVSQTGNDGNNGSLNNPLATVKKALQLRSTFSSTDNYVIKLLPGDYIESSLPLIIPNNTTIQGSGVFSTRIISGQAGSVNLFDIVTGINMNFMVTDLQLIAASGNNAGLNIYPGAISGTEIINARLNNLIVNGFNIGIVVTGVNNLTRGTFILVQNCEYGVGVANGKYCGIGLCVYHTSTGTAALYTFGATSTYVVYDMDVNGTFDYGLFTILGGVCNIIGGKIDGCTNGIDMIGAGTIDCQSIKVLNTTGYSIRTTSAAASVILNNADIRVDQISQFAGSQIKVHGLYHDRHDCAELATIINNSFTLDTESFVREEDIENVLIDYFKDSTKIASSSNIEVIDGHAILSSTGSEVQYENCDAITYFSEVINAADGSISLDNVVFHEGTGSLKATYTLSGAFIGVFRYGIALNVSTKSGSAQDWSTYDELHIWFKPSITGSKIRIQVHDSVSPTPIYKEYTFTSTNWVDVSFDISGFTRTAVDYVLFQFTREAAAYTINIDDIRLVNTPTYAASGTFTSIIQPTAQNLDLYEMLIGTKYSLPSVNTAIQFDISLDGGTHWLTNIGLPQFENWYQTTTGGALEKADGGVAWSNKRQVRVRFTLTTTDTSITPVLDDYALVWRVNKA